MLAIGIVTALLKMFSIGGIVLMPMIGIVMESLIGRAGADSSWASRGGRSFMIAGGVATLWPFFHPFFTQGILVGSGIFTIYERTIQKGATTLGLPATAVLYILAALIAIHFGIGLVGGLLAWDAGRVIQQRLRPSAGEPAT